MSTVRDFKHPNCEGRMLREDGSCRWPYCFDWTPCEEERAIIERAKVRAASVFPPETP